MRDAALSTISNVCEGFHRGGSREFANFVSIALGSGGELKGQCYAASDIGLMSSEDFVRTKAVLDELIAVTGGLLNYLRGTTVKGRKWSPEPEAGKPVIREETVAYDYDHPFDLDDSHFAALDESPSGSG